MRGNAFDLHPLSRQRVRRVRLSRCDDARGSLLPLDFADLPFVPRRAFVIHDVPTGTARGGHAHRSARQLLVCLAGRVDIELCDVEPQHADSPDHAGREGALPETLTLDRADYGLLIEPGVWAAQTYVEPGSMLLVLSSEHYDPGSYIGESLVPSRANGDAGDSGGAHGYL